MCWKPSGETDFLGQCKAEIRIIMKKSLMQLPSPSHVYPNPDAKSTVLCAERQQFDDIGREGRAELAKCATAHELSCHEAEYAVDR